MKVPEQRAGAASFEELARPLFDQLYNFARWLTQNTPEAEDLVQEPTPRLCAGFARFRKVRIFGHGYTASCEIHF